MKKSLLLLIALFSISHAAEARMPSFYYCMDCDYLDGRYYRPGVYLGAAFGYAAIHSPTRGFLTEPENFVITNRGRFAYGLFAGFNFWKYKRNVYLGFEGGLNDNGYSTFLFNCSRNEYRLTSKDWNISGTLTYAFRQCFDVFLKAGVANVWEEFKIVRTRDSSRAIRSILSDKRWVPVISAGVGYSVFEWINFSLFYRGFLCEAQHDLRTRLRFTKTPSNHTCYSWRGISGVQSFYGSVSLVF